MKTALLTIAVLLLAGGYSLAQPVLTAAANTPSAGLSYQVYSSLNYVPGPAGAAQSWDFSTLPYNGPTAYNYTDCGAPGASCGTFPGSNLVEKTSGSQSYFIAGAAAFSIKGVASATAGGNLLYSDPEDLLRFPFTYNDAFRDTFTATIVYNGLTYYRNGIDTVTADAWGSLTTPAGSFAGTLRTRQVSVYRDSAFYNGSPIIIYYRSVAYSWRDSAHQDVLYGTSTVTINSSQSGISSRQASFYTINQSTGLGELSAAALLSVYPNPARDLLSCSLRLIAATEVGASLRDLSGRLVRTFPLRRLDAGNQQLALPVAGLGRGVYLLHIDAGRERLVRKVSLVGYLD